MITIEEASKKLQYNRGSLYSTSEKMEQESFKSGAEFVQKRIAVTEELPPYDTEVLLFNENWKMEQNPEGVRIGFYSYSEDWVSANLVSMDEQLYDTSINQTPTHWRPVNVK